MWYNCKKCWFYKMTDNQKCFCNAKAYDEKKLTKKKDKKPIKQVSEKKTKRIKDNWSEWTMFKNIYKKLCKKWEHECIICSEIVDEDDVIPSCFPHILPKGKFPEYRYFENNIWFVCWIDHHNKFDEAINNFKEDKGLIELEKIIKDWWVPDLSDYIDY